jgi:hypothetical protein
MLEDGLWLDRRRRLKQAHQPRYRRDCLGELVQFDGCEHGWFEDRGRRCSLLVLIDDATSRLMQLGSCARNYKGCVTPSGATGK